MTATDPKDPRIEGQTLFCPGEGPAHLKCSNTQGNNYQWYKRKMTAPDPEPIEGEYGTEITLDLYNATTNFYSVRFDYEGKSYMTPEVQIDQRAFAGLTVSARGNFSGSGGTFIIKDGGYVIFTIGSPYDTNIIWYKDEMPIKGETKTQLKVTTAGRYGVEAAPQVCPNYSARLGSALIVVKE